MRAKKPYLKLFVKGPTSTVHVRLTLTKKNGKVVSRFQTAIETNHLVRVRGFRIAKTVRVIRVGVDA